MLVNHWRKVNLQKRPKRAQTEDAIHLRENDVSDYKIVDILNPNKDENISKEDQIVGEESFVLHSYE